MTSVKKTELLEIKVFDHLTVCKQMINSESNYSY